MCGIAGYLRFDDRLIEQQELGKILDKISHRGRDYCGTMLKQPIALGHRRLSIIDLQDSAAQPMQFHQLTITYNGEIYNYLELKKELKQKNYRFKTNSDTEVLLAAYHYWGEKCLSRLNGMYAFAIWDEAKQLLFCARDPLGIKPFYYFQTSQFFAFASEAYALAHLSQYELNNNAVLSYFLSMYCATNESIFKSITKLPPGHSLEITNGVAKIKRFWQLEKKHDHAAHPDKIAALESTLESAINQQIRSDVPVGGFLSGGIDSGIITALAAPLVKRYHTYSVGYEGMRSNELESAKTLAQRYNTIHTEVTITASDVIKNLDLALAAMSEPIADPAIVATYLLSQLAAQDGVKVLLNGTGGDEVFAGYTRYTGDLSLKRKILLALPQSLKRGLSLLPIDYKMKYRLQHNSLDMLFTTGGSYTLAKSLSSMPFNGYLQTLSQTFNLPQVQGFSNLYQRMLFDLHVYLPEQLLFLLDQMTMAHTVEGRVPLLDTQLINAAYQFKSKEHIRHRKTKALLKNIALPYLGKEHVHRKKQGFAGSPSWWVRHNHKIFLEAIEPIKKITFFSNLNMDRYHKSLNENLCTEMFLLYCFSQWHQRKISS